MNLIDRVMNVRPVLKVAFVSVFFPYIFFGGTIGDFNPLNWPAGNDILYFILTVTIMTRGFCMVYLGKGKNQ